MSKYDFSVLCRNCDSETVEPIRCEVQGEIPSWIKGNIIYNGPGLNEFGNERYNHAFDGAALLQKFNFKESTVEYSCRFVASTVFNENQKAEGITRAEFGTVPKSKGFFKRLITAVDPEKMLSDNTQLSVCKIGNDFYTMGEVPFLNKLDLNTLQTLEKINLNKLYNLVCVSPHPLMDTRDGSIYIIGTGISMFGPKYDIIKFEKDAEITMGKLVASIPCRWKMSPCYVHSMGMSENYIVLVEQPLAVSVVEMMSDIMKNMPFIKALKWHNDKTFIHVIDRQTWQEIPIKYITDPFFMLHFSNVYEEDDHVVFDVPLYKDPTFLQNMYIESLQCDSNDDNFYNSFISKLTRFVIPLKTKGKGNLVKLPDTQCSAINIVNNQVKLQSEQIIDIASENPVINPLYSGKKHSYTWAMGPTKHDSDGGHITKLNNITGEHIEFNETGLYLSQPIFIPHPMGLNEDEGILIAVILKSEDVNFVGLILFNASNLREISRVTVQTDSPKPMPLHGSFFEE